MVKKEGLLKHSYSLFLDSFKDIDKKFPLVILYDFLFYFVLVQAGNLMLLFLQKKASSINLTNDFLALDPAQATSMLSSLKGFLFFVVLAMVLFVLFNTINASLFKGLVWSTSSKKSYNKETFKNFLKINIVWIPSWVILVFLWNVIMTQQAATIAGVITLLLALHLTGIINVSILRKSKTPLKDAFSLGIKKLHFFLIPYLVVSIFFFIFFKLHSLIAASLHLYFNILILLVFLAWTRYFIVRIVDSIRK
ncbi:hypothetical protein ISS07_02165 [Candidatus Woesearchaeota archaeon]|nr:hypothetical protein [Candidatus Woesearchaeota archaeon]